jgi:hypothetical protein
VAERSIRREGRVNAKNVSRRTDAFPATPVGSKLMWPRLFRWRTITGQCWPNALRLASQRFPGSAGKDISIFSKKYTFCVNIIYFFRKFCAIVPSLRGVGVKNQSLGGFFPGPETPKTIFRLRWPRLPHHLASYTFLQTLAPP